MCAHTTLGGHDSIDRWIEERTYVYFLCEAEGDYRREEYVLDFTAFWEAPGNVNGGCPVLHSPAPGLARARQLSQTTQSQHGGGKVPNHPRDAQGIPTCDDVGKGRSH